jgi:hypothetical protein
MKGIQNKIIIYQKAGTPLEEPLDGLPVDIGTDVANISPSFSLPLSSYLNIGLL